MKFLSKRMVLAGSILFAVLIVVLPMASVKWSGAPLFTEPGFMKRLQTYFTTNAAETTDDPVFPELQTPVYDISSNELWDQVQAAVTTFNWERIEVDDSTLEMKAVITTSLMKFQDDISIQVHELEEEKSTLYIKSSSRLGKGDLGANTGHILKLLDRLDQTN